MHPRNKRYVLYDGTKNYVIDIVEIDVKFEL